MRVGIGILGGGTVGGSLANQLLRDADAIKAKSGIDAALVLVGVRDLDKARNFPAEYATDQLEDLVDDERVHLVVELMGGIEPARTLLLRALDAGKPVVTANKELMARHGEELIGRAAERGVSLLFEAAVGGAIPIIRPLSESLAGERIDRVMGIVNGTTNFILTAMEDEGREYEDVLAEAQSLGFAESDPTADVGGHDSAAKAAILAGLAFGVWVDASQVYTEGIDKVDRVDVEMANSLGYTVKLLAIADGGDSGHVVRVHPCLLPVTHQLASVRGASNGIFVEGPNLGQLLFSGPGAGGQPTATAVLGDVITASRELLGGSQVTPRIRYSAGSPRSFDDVENQWYVRLIVADFPGVLAQVAGAFGAAEVSIKSVWQEGRGGTVTLVIITHPAAEKDQQSALDKLRALESVKEIAAVIRVVDSE